MTMTMASDASSSSSPPTSTGQSTTTPILDELKRLQDIESFLTKLWQDEVHQYEQTTTSSSSTGEADADSDHAHHESNCVSRNHANSTGTIENTSLFPYHTALYPLLDCYDSFIEDRGDGVAYYPPTVVRPSPAPMLFELDGHRRSVPRIDRYGVQIQEIVSINEHLPNSAWAIQQSLMPNHRKLQFMDYLANLSDDQHQSSSTMYHHEDRDLERFRKDNYRFWNILLNPELEAYPILSDDMSVSSIESDEWEDSDDEESDDSYSEMRRQVRIRMKPDRLKNATYARDFRFLRWWRRTIVDERRGVIHCKTSDEARKNILALNNRYSPESLFADSTSSSSAICILLKVLKHSLSDLQRELRLAQALVLLIADWKLCDDYKGKAQEEKKDGASNHDNDSIDGIECLRRLLLIISSEYFPSCGGYCHERFLADAVLNEEDEPNHYCSDWWEFLGSFSVLLSEGISFMTQQHASVICAFVFHEMNRASCPSAMGIFFNSGEISGKEYLKQSIYFLNNAEYEMGTRTEGGLPRDSISTGCPLSINILLTIVNAMRLHALSDRLRLVKLIDEMNASSSTSVAEQNEVSQYLSSYQTCIEIMVDIGERALFRLPNNLQGRQLGGMVVRGLVEAFIGGDNFTMKAQRPLSYLARGTESTLRSIVDPLRYADAVTKSINHPLLDPCRGHNRTGTVSIGDFIGIQPTKDVIDIVKGLFTRDLVDLQVSGCGYGDFLSWCHLPISPEPLLFSYVSNFPDLREGDEREPPSEEWAVDEERNALDHAYLSARYDFSLLVFLRHWHSPWTPESHFSFSVPFRSAVSTLALCAHRFGVPSDIVALVNSFLPRVWWPDDRRCCWCQDCQLDQLSRVFNNKVRSRKINWGKQPGLGLETKKKSKPDTLNTCSGCQVALACSKEHMKFLHRDGHKRYCGLPPFRAPFAEEDNNLCREVLGTLDDVPDAVPDDHHDSNQDDDNDDGSWESVDSNQDAADGRSDVIFKYFNNKSYKFQQRVQIPFWS